MNLWSGPCAINCGLMPILTSPSKERKKRQDFSEQCSTQLPVFVDSAVCVRNLKWLSLPFVMTRSVSASCRVAGWLRSSGMKGAVLLWGTLRARGACLWAVPTASPGPCSKWPPTRGGRAQWQNLLATVGSKSVIPECFLFPFLPVFMSNLDCPILVTLLVVDTVIYCSVLACWNNACNCLHVVRACVNRCMFCTFCDCWLALLHKERKLLGNGGREGWLPGQKWKDYKAGSY